LKYPEVGRKEIIITKPACYFCHSKRQRNLILVSEDSIGNPELTDSEGVHGISKTIKYHDAYKRMRRIYWVCRRCFYLNPSKCRRYRDIREKSEAVASRRLECG
jgi:hypothetical protein